MYTFTQSWWQQKRDYPQSTCINMGMACDFRANFRHMFGSYPMAWPESPWRKHRTQLEFSTVHLCWTTGGGQWWKTGESYLNWRCSAQSGHMISILWSLTLNATHHQIWLVLWNMNFMNFHWEFHHPNWLSLHHFSRWWNCTTNQKSSSDIDMLEVSITSWIVDIFQSDIFHQYPAGYEMCWAWDPSWECTAPSTTVFVYRLIVARGCGFVTLSENRVSPSCSWLTSFFQLKC